MHLHRTSRLVAALAMIAGCIPERIAGDDDVPDAIAAQDASGDALDAVSDATPDSADAPPVIDVPTEDAPPDVPTVLDVPITPDLGPADTGPAPVLPIPTGPCDFVGLLDGGASLTSSTVYPVAGFRVEVDAHGLRAEHTDEPERDVLATALAGGMIHASTGALVAAPNGATYTVSQAPGATCKAARVATVASGHDRVVIDGAFEDGGDCDGASFRVLLCQPRPDELALTVELGGEGFVTPTLRLASEPSERILGLGEQLPAETLDLKGRAIPVIAQRGGIGRGQSPVTEVVDAASPGAGGSPETTPYAVPFFLTSAGRALYLANDEVSLFSFSPSATEVSVRSTTLDARVLHGVTPLELVERLTDHTGRMPAPPGWTDAGAIVGLAGGTGQSLIRLDALLDKGALITAVWRPDWSGATTTSLRPWSWPMTPEDALSWKTWGDTLADKGIRTLCQVDPVLRPLAGPAPDGARDLYKEAIDAGFVVQGPGGAPAQVTGDDGRAGALLDLTNPAAVAWMQDLLRTEVLKAARCEGWTAPAGELLPLDATLASGESAEVEHNRYPVRWASLQTGAIQKTNAASTALVMVRAGHTQSPGAGPMVWTGEQLTTWDGNDGFASALRALIGGGLSGIALNHMETGGSTSVASYGLVFGREPELLRRWVEASAFTSLLRTTEGDSPADNAQLYTDDASMEHFARFTRIFKALAAYRGTLHDEAATHGWPVVRHLALHFPEDPQSWLVDDEFLLGSEILVAPTLERCLTPPACPYARQVYLPPGVWTHLWTGKDYGVVASGSTVTVAAPIGRPAVFYRKASSVGLSLVQNLTLLGVEL